MARQLILFLALAVVIGGSAGLLWVHAAGYTFEPVTRVTMDLNLPPVVQEGPLAVTGTATVVGGPAPATLELTGDDNAGHAWGPVRFQTVLKRNGLWGFDVPYLPMDTTGSASVNVLLTSGDLTFQKTFTVTVTGGDFDVNLAAPPDGWIYENAGNTTANRHAVTFTATVENDETGSVGYEYTWEAVTNPATGKRLVLVAGGGPDDNWARFAAPQRAAGNTRPYVVTCCALGKPDWGWEYGLTTGEALGAGTVVVRSLGDIDGNSIVNAIDKLNFNKRLNGLTTAYPDRCYDLTGDGLVNAVDKLQMNRILNGLPIP